MTVGASITYSSNITQELSIHKYGNSTTNILALTGNSSYTGHTIISQGILAFNSIANVVGGNSALGAPATVSFGTIDLGGDANAVTLRYTGTGHSTDRVINLFGTTASATLDMSGTGTLTFTSAATINLGSGAALSFANSSAVDWSGGTLDLTGNFVSGSSIRFGMDGGGLTPSQLALISINGNAAHLVLDNLGYLIGGYPAWKTANAPVTGANPNSDEDGDGVANGVEFVLGGLIGTRDSSRLPEISTSGGNMLFTLKRDRKSIGGTSVLRIETSPNLIEWTTGCDVPDGSASASPGVTVIKDVPTGFDTVTLSLPLSDYKKFARLKVTP